jgi:hypothetical protein
VVVIARCLICGRVRPTHEMHYEPAETENGIEDEWICGDDPSCVPWILFTRIGQAWGA